MSNNVIAFPGPRTLRRPVTHSLRPRDRGDNLVRSRPVIRRGAADGTGIARGGAA